MTGDRDRVLAFLRDFAVRTAGRVEELTFGVALFNDELPQVRDLNYAWIDGVPPGLDAAGLAGELDRVQGRAGLEHRKALSPDERGGDRLAPGLRELGWRTERHLLMAHRRAPDRASDLNSVTEVGEDEIRALSEAGLRSDTAWFSEEAIRQITAQKQVVAAAGARFFAVMLGSTVATGCDLYSDAGIAQVESVITLEEYRNRGFGRAVVLKAITEARAAGAELVFLLAEEDDWPKELYRKLGFDAMGTLHVFMRPPP